MGTIGGAPLYINEAEGGAQRIKRTYCDLFLPRFLLLINHGEYIAFTWMYR